MKPELINLLDRLKRHPGQEGFHSLLITANGHTRAVFRHGTLKFESLEDLEAYAYAPFENLETVTLTSSAPVPAVPPTAVDIAWKKATVFTPPLSH